METGAQVLVLVERRRAMLERLTRAPAHKRDLVDDLDVSRSTVDRAVSELLDAGLVEETAEGYDTTHVGRLALATVGDAVRTLETVDEAAELLSFLPADAMVPPAVFADATVHVTDDVLPMPEVSAFIDRVERADELLGLSRADNHSGWRETLYRRSVVERELDVELVLDRDLVAFYREENPELLADTEGLDNVALWASDGIPFGLFLLRGPGFELVLVGAYDEQARYRGALLSEHPVAVDWAESLFRRYREGATPLPETAESEP